MRVGELATRTGASVRAIRHYERSGLVGAHRRPNGYREFTGEAVDQVGAIRDLLQAGLTVEEIRGLSPCLPAGTGTPGGCRRLTAATYRDKLARVEQQLAALGRLRERITERLALLECEA